MPTEPQPVTMFEVVRRAVEVCDDGTDNGLDELLDKFEDDDEPISAIGDVEMRLTEKIGPPEFDEDDRDAPRRPRRVRRQAARLRGPLACRAGRD
jgi:hypothetical protein